MKLDFAPAGHRRPCSPRATVASILVLVPIAWTAGLATGAGVNDAAPCCSARWWANCSLNTLGLIAATAVVTAIVATAVAWCVERTDLARAPALGGAGRGPARHPILHHQLRLGIDESRRCRISAAPCLS